MDAITPTTEELEEAFEIALRHKDNSVTDREATRLCHIDGHAFDDVNKLWVITTKGPKTINRGQDGECCYSASKKAGRVLGAVDYERVDA